MVNDASDCGWLDAVNQLVDIMTTRICTCQAKYTEQDELKVVRRLA